MGYSRKLKRLKRKSRKYKGGIPSHSDIMKNIRKMVENKILNKEGYMVNSYTIIPYTPYDILRYIRSLKLLSISSNEDKKLLSDISRYIIDSSEARTVNDMGSYDVKSYPNAVRFRTDSTILCEAKKLGLLLDIPFLEQFQVEQDQKAKKEIKTQQTQGISRTNQATLLQGVFGV